MSCFCLHCPELFPAAGVGNASAMGWEQLGHGNVPAGCPCGEGILELPSLGCGSQPKIRLHSKALLVERHLLLFSSCPWLVFPASSSSAHLPQPVSRATAEMPAGSSFWSFQLLQEQDSCPHEQGFVGLSANPPHPGLGFIPSLISPGENLPDP